MKRNLTVNNVARVIGTVIGSMLFLWFALPFAVAGILNIGNVTGMVVAAILVMYAMLSSHINKCILRIWGQRKLRGVLIGCGGLLVGIAILAMIETVCIVNANLKKPEKNATAVVLGCRVYGERASLSLVERLEAAYEYLEENPDAVCVVSGGQGAGENISEAECMYRWLVDAGIEPERIYKEEKSTSTEENIAFSVEIIKENELNENIAIVTSEYHSYRAGIIAKKNDMSFGTAPGQTAIWLFPTYYIRELYGILAEWIF